MFLDPDKTIEKHRVNLPHWQQAQAWLFVTWRLADSLPESVVRKLDEQRKRWESTHPKPWTDGERNEHNRLFTLNFEALLDDAHGSCVLREPAMSGRVADALLHFHGERYALDRFVVMPNHVHVLFQPLGKKVGRHHEILEATYGTRNQQSAGPRGRVVAKGLLGSVSARRAAFLFGGRAYQQKPGKAATRNLPTLALGRRSLKPLCICVVICVASAKGMQSPFSLFGIKRPAGVRAGVNSGRYPGCRRSVSPSGRRW